MGATANFTPEAFKTEGILIWKRGWLLDSLFGQSCTRIPYLFLLKMHSFLFLISWVKYRCSRCEQASPIFRILQPDKLLIQFARQYRLPQNIHQEFTTKDKAVVHPRNCAFKGLPEILCEESTRLKLSKGSQLIFE
jgi:hypothetical protein